MKYKKKKLLNQKEKLKYTIFVFVWFYKVFV